MANANAAGVTLVPRAIAQTAPKRHPTPQKPRQCDFSNLRKGTPGAVEGALSVLSKHIDGHRGTPSEIARAKFHELVAALNTLT